MQLSLRLQTFATIAAAVALLTGGAHPARSAATSSGLSFAEVEDTYVRFAVSGIVVAMDYATNTVTVKAGGQTVRVMITPTTVIEKHGDTGSIADIRKGAKISVSGAVRNGHNIALSIVVK